ncbi:MAG TPA: acyl-CoA dehydrogenase family protein [Mycobacteriales bacterium]|nr:acyl-CoA dehydrogenase family protein [Mycobacteriales bacterium]
MAGSVEGRYAGDLSEYRVALRTFLGSSDLDAWRGCYIEDVAEEMKFVSGMVQVIYDADFGRYGFPVAVGGLGGDVRHWAVMYDELVAAGLPLTGQHSLITTLAQPIARYAPKIAARYLPAFARGDEWWGQGFSEPEAGSDLASLRCRAVLDGDHYVVSGQKLWTSHGATASHTVLLCRTGTAESRHRGLSMLFLDNDMPGVEIRPIYLASGRAELAECFFDEVRVPVDRLIGEAGQGWEIAMYLLQFERAVYAWQRAAVLLERLGTLAVAVRSGELARRQLGTAYLDLIGLRARSVETVRRLAAGETVGPEASADKLLLGAAEQSVYDAARSLLGERFAFSTDPAMRRWGQEWWFSRTTTIYGGAAEVQRGIIADRVLNLPKG